MADHAQGSHLIVDQVTFEQVKEILQRETKKQFPNILSTSHFVPPPSPLSCKQSESLASAPPPDCTAGPDDSEDVQSGSYKSLYCNTGPLNTYIRHRNGRSAYKQHQHTTCGKYTESSVLCDEEHGHMDSSDCKDIDIDLSRNSTYPEAVIDCCCHLPCRCSVPEPCKLTDSCESDPTATHKGQMRNQTNNSNTSCEYHKYSTQPTTRRCSDAIQCAEDIIMTSDTGQSEELAFRLGGNNTTCRTDLNTSSFKTKDGALLLTTEEGDNVMRDQWVNSESYVSKSDRVVCLNRNKSAVLDSQVLPSKQQHKETLTKVSVSDQSERPPAPLQDSDVRDEETQQQVLRCLNKLTGEVMFVLSQFNFRSYLSNPEYADAVADLPRPVGLKSQNKHRGDFDILIIHREYGIIVAEIKSVGNNFSTIQMPEDKQDEMVAKRIQQSIKQLYKADDVLNHLLSDVSTKLTIKKTVMLPNIDNVQLTRVLLNSPELKTNLSSCIGIPMSEDPRCYCLTANDMNDPTGWWQQRVASADIPPVMTDSLYLDLVSRFAGPATTVTVQCNSPTPQKVLQSEDSREQGPVGRTRAKAKRTSNTSLVHFVGPPGTGKKAQLIRKGTKLLQRGYDVHVLSSWRRSRSTSRVIAERLKETAVTGTQEKVHLHEICLEHSTADQAKESLARAVEERTLVIIAYDVCDNGHTASLIQWLHQKVPNLHFYAASCSKGNLPLLKTEYMSNPVRSQPAPTRSVLRASIKARAKNATVPTELSAQQSHRQQERYTLNTPAVPASHDDRFHPMGPQRFVLGPPIPPGIPGVYPSLHWAAWQPISPPPHFSSSHLILPTQDLHSPPRAHKTQHVSPRPEHVWPLHHLPPSQLARTNIEDNSAFKRVSPSKPQPQWASTPLQGDQIVHYGVRSSAFKPKGQSLRPCKSDVLTERARTRDWDLDPNIVDAGDQFEYMTF
ncbi:uncharacterized protein [Littorina saxatilis]|uniref:uncharacterized protein n=1 Tax=Littorina saxatilis TaxID=31220 RepID=UPI0038B539AD